MITKKLFAVQAAKFFALYRPTSSTRTIPPLTYRRIYAELGCHFDTILIAAGIGHIKASAIISIPRATGCYHPAGTGLPS